MDQSLEKRREICVKAADLVLSLFYPRKCPVCQDIVWPMGGRICSDCRKKIHYIEQPTCRKCGKEIAFAEKEYCPDCERRHRSFSGGVSLMHYDEVGKASIQGFKYHGRPEYGAFYIEEILRIYGDELRDFGADAIVPVPIHKSRLRKRGYNQAEVLGKELSRRMGIPLLKKVLVRKKKTTAQKELSAGDRMKNMERVMEARPLPEGIRRVFLVDDIYTTGSTAEACTRALLGAGVEEVFVVTVCIGESV